MRATGARQGLTTTMYVTKDEFSVVAKLPAKTLKKTRYSVPPFGIDVFEDTLAGLVLAEAEFSSDSEASSLTLPPFIVREVSHDDEFAGGYLAGIARHEFEELLAKYGIMLNTTP